MNDLRRVFGARLKALRARRGFTQEELASRAGLHATYLSDLERGEQTPTLDVVNRIARGLGATLAELFESFEEPCRVRFRKRRRDAHRRSK